jgi:archaellum biogenesis ATPase FlaH
MKTMRIEDELADLNGHKTLLAFSPATDLQTNIGNAIEYMVKKRHMNCIYVSLNKPSGAIERLLEERRIPKEKVFIVDCITGRVVHSRSRNVAFVSRPYNLTDMGISIAQFAKTVKGNGFVMLDTLEVLQMYNRPEVVLQFVHSLTSLPAKYGLRLLVLATVEVFRGEISKFVQYFDKIAEVTPVKARKTKPVRLKI